MQLQEVNITRRDDRPKDDDEEAGHLLQGERLVLVADPAQLLREALASGAVADHSVEEANQQLVLLLRAQGALQEANHQAVDLE